jgi:hypothetical protein
MKCASSAGAKSLGQTRITRDLTLNQLRSRIPCDAQDAAIYLYVVNTVKLSLSKGLLEQTGPAPNFDGDYITLCACKHWMRTYLTPDEWMKTWVAGFTSCSQFKHRNWLVYLMKVGEAYLSHRELVAAFMRDGRGSTLEAKFAHKSSIGDVFLPTSANADPYDPGGYLPPDEGRHEHRGSKDDTQWHEDIRPPRRAHRPPALLVGDKVHSYLWTRPMIWRFAPRLLTQGSPKSQLSLLVSDLVSE